MLTNSTVPARAPGAFTGKIAAAAMGKPIAAPKEVKIDPKVFDQYAGKYELQPGFVITFFSKGDRFWLQATGQGAAEIFAESETKFFLKVVDGSVEFVKDASGKVTGMVLTQNGQKLPAKRIEK
jgi:hypothetical protein